MQLFDLISRFDNKVLIYRAKTMGFLYFLQTNFEKLEKNEGKMNFAKNINSVNNKKVSWGF